MPPPIPTEEKHSGEIHGPGVDDPSAHLAPWQNTIRVIIFEADTPLGKIFDIALLVCIILSVLAVVLESVDPIREQFGGLLYACEWGFTILFTIEYILRLLSVARPSQYAISFFGIVDILAILPTYLSLFIADTQSLIVIRALRILRIFRVFKLARYLREAQTLLHALHETREKITVFLVVIATLVLILGAMMYLIEGPENGFDSIPTGIYWAIVTITTVGFGDITPKTPIGQALAAMAMILGYCIIIVPTGIFSAEIMKARRGQVSTVICPVCTREGHEMDASYCKFCGGKLRP